MIRDAILYFNIFKKYLGKATYLLIILSIISVISDSFGISLLIPLFQTLDSDIGFLEGNGLLVDATNSIFSILNIEINTESLLIALTLIFLLKGAINFLTFSIISKFLGAIIKKIKSEVCIDSFNMSYSYYLEKNSGYFANIINEQTKNVGIAFKFYFRFIKTIIDSFFYVFFALLVSTRSAITLLVISTIIFSAFNNLNKKVKKISRNVVDESSNLSNSMIEMLQSYKYMRATGNVRKFFNSLSRSINNIAKLEIKAGIYEGLTITFRETASIICVLLIIANQYYFVKEPITPILVSLALLYRGVNAIFGSQYAWQIFLKYIGSLEIINSEHKIQLLNKEENGKIFINKLKSSIKINDMSFSFQNGSNILNKINLEIPVNTSIAIVGKSGSGKSTLINLLLGLLKPSKGEILIDNEPLSKIELDSWRCSIGYVSQETVMFNETIADNITLNFNRKELKDAELKSIKSAAKAANINSYIESLPNGYNTIVGEKGLKLSGGQRQRIFIARELYKGPKVLMMDEATSSLDYKSEEFIKKSLDTLKGKATIIIVAHRLSTIRNVDLIYVIKDGSILESGTYTELKSKKGSHFNYLNQNENLL